MNAFIRKYSPTKLIAISSFFSLGLIVLLAGFIHLNVNKIIAIQDAYTAKISVSGFQYMLSQRAAFFTTAYVDNRDIQDKKTAEGALILLKNRHQESVNTLNDSSSTDVSQALRSLYFDQPTDLDRTLTAYIASIERMLRNPRRVSDRDLEDLKIASRAIIERFDAVLQQYETESETKVDNLRRVQVAILVTIVALFLIQVFVVINPLLKMAEKLSSRLIDEANIDPLTDLHNRRLLDTITDQLIADFKRYQNPLTLVIIDIDDLKKINDSYGHAVGDKAIQVVARVIKSISRKSDKAFRMGGEEFLLILPNTKAEGAYVLVEKIRQAVQSMSDSTAAEKIQFTISSGVSEMSKAENTIKSALKRADDALYQAKGTSKNKTIVATV